MFRGGGKFEFAGSVFGGERFVVRTRAWFAAVDACVGRRGLRGWKGRRARCFGGMIIASLSVGVVDSVGKVPFEVVMRFTKWSWVSSLALLVSCSEADGPGNGNASGGEQRDVGNSRGRHGQCGAERRIRRRCRKRGWSCWG